MQKVINGIGKLSDWSGKVTSILVLPMVLVTMYMVIMRYFFHVGTDWGYEIVIFLYGMYFMLSGGYCLKLKGHVSVDIISKLVPVTAQRVLEIVTNLIIILFCIVLVWQGTKVAWQSTLILERSIHATVFNPQIWWFKWVIPISGVLLLLQSLGNMLEVIQNMTKKEVG